MSLGCTRVLVLLMAGWGCACSSRGPSLAPLGRSTTSAQLPVTRPAPPVVDGGHPVLDDTLVRIVQTAFLPFVLQKGADPGLVIDLDNRIVSGDGRTPLGIHDLERALQVRRLAPRPDPLMVHVSPGGERRYRCLTASNAAVLVDDQGIAHRPFAWIIHDSVDVRIHVCRDGEDDVGVPREPGPWDITHLTYVYALPDHGSIGALVVDGEPLVRFEPPLCRWPTGGSR